MSKLNTENVQVLIAACFDCIIEFNNKVDAGSRATPENANGKSQQKREDQMLVTVAWSVVLVGLATVIHYEVLRLLNQVLPTLKLQARAKLLLVMFAATIAHLVEIAVYALGIYGLIRFASVGSLSGLAELSLVGCFYFSAETYTSLGLGDVLPVGPIRLIAGIETLNGLLLIGWSASYTYISMERFWTVSDSQTIAGEPAAGNSD